jgi:hypothetical protein
MPLGRYPYRIFHRIIANDRFRIYCTSAMPRGGRGRAPPEGPTAASDFRLHQGVDGRDKPGHDGID